MKKVLVTVFILILSLIQNSVFAEEIYLSGDEIGNVSYDIIKGEQSIILGTDNYVSKSDTLNISKTVQGLAENGKRIQLSAAAGVALPQIIKYEFEIITPGLYRLEFIAGACDVSTLSGYTFKVDNKSIAVTGSNLQSKETVTDTKSLFIKAKLKEGFNLSRGKHTFEINITSYRANGTVLTCFESAEFVRESAFEKNIYGSDANTNNMATYSNYGLAVGDGKEYKDRGTTVHIQGGTADTAKYFPNEGFIFNYEVDIEVGGLYKLESIIAGDVEHNYLSDISIAINDSSAKELNSSTYTTREIITASNGTTKLLAKYDTEMVFRLKEGINIFKIIIPYHNTTSNRTLTYFDSAKLVYAEQEDDIAVEESNSEKFTNLYNDGDYAVTRVEQGEQELLISYPFEVNKDGMYSLDVLLGGSMEESMIAVDGSDYRVVDSSQSKKTSETVIFYENDEDSELTLAKYSMPYVYKLTEGIHTVNIKVIPTEIGYIKGITIKPNDEKQVIYINREDYESGKDDDTILVYPFNVVKEGYYCLDEIALNNNGFDELNFTIDDAEYLDLSDSVSYLSSETVGNLIEFYTNKKYYLKKGYHELKIGFSSATDASCFEYSKLSFVGQDNLVINGTDGYVCKTSGEFVADYTTGNKNVLGDSYTLCIYDNSTSVVLDYIVNCDKAGYYNLNIVSSDGISYAVNGESYSLADSASSSYYDATKKIHRVEPLFYLKEGENTFSLCIDEANTTNYFAYAEFDYLSKPESICVNLKENNYSSTNGDIATKKVNYKTGKYFYTKIEGTSYYPFSKDITYSFSVEKAGNYLFDLAVSNMNNVTFSIDGVEYNLRNVTTKEHPACSDLKIYPYSESIYLSEGEHFLNFKLSMKSSVLVDYISFERTDSNDLYIYTHGDDFVEIGDSIQAVVWDKYEDVSYQDVIFTSLDESIINVTENGVVTGVGVGKANICATVTLSDGSRISLLKEMIVTIDNIYVEFGGMEIDGVPVISLPDNGVYNVNVKYDVVNVLPEYGQVALIVAIYKNNQMVDVKTLSDELVRGCDIINKNINISNVTIKDGVEIAIFAWDSMTGIKPIIKKQIFTQEVNSLG